MTERDTLPRGMVTFLVTDIEGSTALWEADRAAMPAAVARHDALLSEAVSAHDGVLFKHVGDAAQAAFATAGQARRRRRPTRADRGALGAISANSGPYAARHGGGRTR